MQKIITFYNLALEYNVVIPIIQRDYAQGRDNDDAKNVRKDLLIRIKEALDLNKKLDLNFVYGTEISLENKNSSALNKNFLPVDGQQRLTTLFLLHYYIFIASGNKETLKELGVFSYETRSSALEFFSWLCKCEQSLVKAINEPQKSNDDNDSLKNLIYNMPEYQAAWNYDPTVCSALIMLSEIKKKFGTDPQKLKDYYEKLIKPEADCPIVFTVISDDSPNASDKADKTYIRMNARGKKLDRFENLRAAIDSIRDKIQNNDWNTDVIGNYDREYLYTLFSKTKGDTLKARTNTINSNSLNLFMNIYNILALVGLENKKLDYKSNEGKYQYCIFDYSKSQDLINDESLKKVFRIYIDMIDSYFRYCQKYNNEFLLDVFTNSEYIDGKEYKEDEAKIIYCYWYFIKNNDVPSEEKIKWLQIVLKNLNITEWNERFLNLFQFCEMVSSYANVYDCFKNIPNAIDLMNRLTLVKDKDFYVRFKEQKIKSSILKDNNLDEFYFNEFEEKITGRKLQFLLYIAGYWDNYKYGNLTNLKEYLSNAKKWFLNNATDNLKFRKLYAIAVYLDNSYNIRSAQDIDKDADTNKHIWDENVLFWNDNDENDPCQGWKVECDKLRLVFMLNNNIFTVATNKLLSNQNYKKCWLKYAIRDNHSDLLQNKLSKINNDLFINDSFGKKRLFFLYVAKLNHDDWIWGDIQTVNKYVSCAIFFDGKEAFKEITNGKYLIPLGAYSINNNSLEVDETFNVRVIYNCTVQLGKGNKDSSLYCINIKNETVTYDRYIYNSNSVFILDRETFDVSDAIKDIKNKCEAEKKNIDSFNNMDYLVFFEEYDKKNRKDTNKTSGYYRGYGSSRTWTKNDLIQYTKQYTNPVTSTILI